MPALNKVILAGNLTRDPDMRVTATGMAICKFGIAINRKFSTKSGEQREDVTFVDIDSFGKQAEVISKYCKKGSALLLEGRLKLDMWESNDGQKRSKLGVVLETFQFLPSGQGSSNDRPGDSQASPRSEPAREPASTSDDGFLDEEEPPF